MLAACSSVPPATPTPDAGTGDAGLPDAGPAPDATPPPARFTTDTHFVRDAQGRAVILRGVNVAHTAKRSPDGLPWVGKEDVARLRTDFGLNVIRLTLFWRFVEPTRGQYDQGYLDRIRQILDWADAAQVLVLLDMHQDLFGFQATDQNEGDGPPEWARDPTCPPFADEKPWFLNYFSEGVTCQFRSFYANTGGVQDAFAAMWMEVAAALADHPAVVGLDLFNEPWVTATQHFADVLGPLYQRVIPAVRQAAPQVLVFYEPGALGGNLVDQAPPRPDFDGLVYAPHFYPQNVALAGSMYDGNTMPLSTLLSRHTTDAMTAGVPVFVGELGADEGVTDVAQYYRDVRTLFGGQLIGFARWSYDTDATYPIAMLDSTPAKAPLPSTVAMLEPFAERIPGTPTATRVDLDARRLELDLDAADGGELVIACPSRFCTDGTTLSAQLSSGPLSTAPTYDAALGQVHVTLPSGARGTVTVSW
jgi:endoglycosylceramidase